MRKEYIIEKQYQGLNIKEYSLIKGINKRALKDIKMNGNILLNNKPVFVSAKLNEGDFLILDYPKETTNVTPWNYDLKIVYEDDYLLIIDKEANIPCIPTRGHREHTIANALKYYYDKNNINSAIHLVNRLDKDTSGYMLIAKSREIHYLFSRNIKQIKRIYHCLVEGYVDRGTIDKPILKLEKEMKRIIDAKGKESITHYKAIKHYKDKTLVECQLETGRTHQIRVHFSSIDHPLIGDSLYGGKEGNYYLESVSIAFIHPITNEYICLNKYEDKC